VTALGSSFLTLTNATDSVEKKQLALEKTSVSLKGLYKDLAEATAKYGQDSEQVAEIQEKIKIKEEQLAQQTSDLKQAQQQLSLTYISTTASMINSVMALSSGFGTLIRGAGAVESAFGGLKNSTMLLGSGMNQLSGLMQVVNKTAILTFVSSPWGLAITGISIAIGALILNVGGLRDALFNALQVVGEWLKNLPILGDLIKGVTSLIFGFKDAVFGALQGFYEWLKNLPVIGTQLQMLENAIKGLIDLFSKLLSLFNTKIDFKLPEFKWPFGGGNEIHDIPEISIPEIPEISEGKKKKKTKEESSLENEDESSSESKEKKKKSKEEEDSSSESKKKEPDAFAKIMFDAIKDKIDLKKYFREGAKLTLTGDNMVKISWKSTPTEILHGVPEIMSYTKPLHEMLSFVSDLTAVSKELNKNQEFVKQNHDVSLKALNSNTAAMKELTQALVNKKLAPVDLVIHSSGSGIGGFGSIHDIESRLGKIDPNTGRKILGAETYENRRTGESSVTFRTQGGNTVTYVKNRTF
jgi:hypothetical protein